MLAAHRVFGGAPGVAGGRAENVQIATGALERVLEQIAEKLERDVLERERRSVRQVQQVQSRLERRDRRDVVAAEIRRGIRPIDDRAELGRRNVVDESRQYGSGKRAIRSVAQREQL